MGVDEAIAEVAAETAAETTEEILDEVIEENAEAEAETIEVLEETGAGASPVMEVSAALDMDARIRQIVRDECGVIISGAIETHQLTAPHGETVVIENSAPEPMETEESHEEIEDEPPDLGHKWYRNFR